MAPSVYLCAIFNSSAPDPPGNQGSPKVINTLACHCPRQCPRENIQISLACCLSQQRTRQQRHISFLFQVTIPGDGQCRLRFLAPYFLLPALGNRLTSCAPRCCDCVTGFFFRKFIGIFTVAGRARSGKRERDRSEVR